MGRGVVHRGHPDRRVVVAASPAQQTRGRQAEGIMGKYHGRGLVTL